MRRAIVESKENGGRTTMPEDLLVVFENEYRFIDWATPEATQARPVATNDIHQMTKARLLEEARKFPGLKVSTAMTVGKIKDAILDYTAANAEDNVSIVEI